MESSQFAASLARSRTALGGATLLGLAVVGTDLWGASERELSHRLLIGVLSALVLVALARGDWRGVGLGLSPRRGWKFWIIAAVILGAIVAAAVALFGAYLWLSGDFELPPPLLQNPGEFTSWGVNAIVIAPLVEEPIYRLLLCVPLLPLLGKWPTIAVSGAVFAGLHVLYGNPAPDNAVAGFLLAWAFLESESLLVPITLHALGNSCVFLSNIAYFYWYT